MTKFSQEIEVSGHIIDSLILTKIFDKIMDLKGEFQVIPGVLDSTTNFIEHPELVADRIVRYAETVGRENVIAGSDCGYGTFILSRRVDANIAWAKLQSLVEGAKLATSRLFP